MDAISQLTNSLKDEMIATRRYFHSHPERGWLTFLASAKIAKKLQDLGFEISLGDKIVAKEYMQGVESDDEKAKALSRAKDLLNDDELCFLEPMSEFAQTGVVGEIDTKRAGKCVAFRFDIDAVEVKESKDSSHRPSKLGFNADVDICAHTCGHDGHIAIGLALAKLIATNLDKFSGKFKFIFQTAEEGTRGAVSMAEAGITDGVDYLFGAHIGFQATKDRSIICGTNKFLATSKFDVYFKGISAHAAGAPESGANALLAAATAAISMHAITRNAKGVTRINVGKLIAGEGRNVIAPNGFLACESRGETTELNEFMFKKAMNAVKGAAEIYGVDYEVKMVGGTAGGNSSKEITKIYEECAKESPFIDNELITKELDFGACEDFAHLMNDVQSKGGQSGYMMIGTSLKAGHHNCCFDFNEDALHSGLDVLYRAALKVNG